MKNKLIDTSACTNSLCRIRYKCLRYSGIPEEYQSYCNFISECFESDFLYFIKMEE